MPYFKNDEVNILFIHIPKTGGTSIEIYFSKKINIPLGVTSLFCYSFGITIQNIYFSSSLQHCTYETIFKYKELLNVNFENMKIITIIRNPYERIISDLFHFKFIDKNTDKNKVFDIIKYYLLNNLDNHNIPQYLFITIDKQLIPNIHILHTETLTQDMHDLGYEDFNINLNVNPSKLNYYDYLNNDSIELINDFYHDDFILFNYKKLNPHVSGIHWRPIISYPRPRKNDP